jgi:hypothetical protein
MCWYQDHKDLAVKVTMDSYPFQVVKRQKLKEMLEHVYDLGYKSHARLKC